MPVPTNNKILIVDDEPMNRLFLTDLLKMHDFDPIAAVNGQDAVHHWLTGAFLVILMDIQMPEMNGLDATRFIRQKEQEEGRAKTPIIAVTAYGTAASQDDCELAGMDAYIPKPIRISELMDSIAIFY